MAIFSFNGVSSCGVRYSKEQSATRSFQTASGVTRTRDPCVVRSITTANSSRRKGTCTVRSIVHIPVSPFFLQDYCRQVIFAIYKDFSITVVDMYSENWLLGFFTVVSNKKDWLHGSKLPYRQFSICSGSRKRACEGPWCVPTLPFDHHAAILPYSDERSLRNRWRQTCVCQRSSTGTDTGPSRTPKLQAKTDTETGFRRTERLRSVQEGSQEDAERKELLETQHFLGDLRDFHAGEPFHAQRQPFHWKSGTACQGTSKDAPCCPQKSTFVSDCYHHLWRSDGPLQQTAAFDC